MRAKKLAMGYLPAKDTPTLTFGESDMYRFVFVASILLGANLSFASAFEQERQEERHVLSPEHGDVGMGVATIAGAQAGVCDTHEHLLERVSKVIPKGPLALINGGRGEVAKALADAGYDVYVQEKNAALIQEGVAAGLYEGRVPRAQNLKEFIALRKEGPRYFSYAVVQDWWEMDESDQEVSMKTLAALLKPQGTIVFSTALFDYFPNAKVRHVPPYQYLMDDLRAVTYQRFDTCEEWVLKFPHIGQAQIHLTLRRQ